MQDLKTLMLVHGDIHPGNVCLLGEKTSLIDFGWCQHYSFGMDHAENQVYQHALTKEFDRQHWYLSMDAEWSHYVWWPHLTHHTAMLHLPITTSFFF
jgi:predicted unusual protein kinase regulating ubiquinone biosynthesis (AarF/ABC1/UbiB family)